MQRITALQTAAVLTLCLTAGAQAQGLLPVASSTTVAVDSGPVLVGQTVPEQLKVTDSSGTVRMLLSYKSPTEVLALAFLSDRCPGNRQQWPAPSPEHPLADGGAIRRFYEAYKDWHVSFVAIQADPRENPRELRRAMDQAGLPFPLVQDGSQAVRATLQIRYTPEWVLIDESAVLRYRGPLYGIRQAATGPKTGTPYLKQAMDAVVGHSEPVPNPEPGEMVGCELP